MKTERSILVFTSISLLALAIFTSYHTPQVDISETEYLIEIENYRKEVTDRIAIDNRRINELNARFEFKKGEIKKNDEEELAMLKEKINEMRITMKSYDANGLEEWESFKEKFEGDLIELHESLINLIIKTSYSLNSDNSISKFAKP